MKPRSLLFYLAAFLAVALFYYLYEIYWGEKLAGLEEAEAGIFNVEIDEIQAFRYRRGDREIEIEREDVDAWRIVRPISTPADRWTVEGMIRAALGGKKDRTFNTGTDDLSEFGLDDPEITLTILAKSSVKGTKEYEPAAPTLLLGKENPIGDSRYARLEGDSSQVFTVPLAYFQDLTTSLYDLRDKSLVLFPGEKIDRLRIKASREVVLHKKSLRTWEVIDPQPGPADNDVVQRILYSGLKGRVERFENPEKIREYMGFDKPRVELEVMSEGKKVADLIVGGSVVNTEEPGQPPKTWVKSSERSEAMLIGDRMVETLTLRYDDIRDRHVLPVNRRTLVELKITRGERVFHAVKKDTLWETVEPTVSVSKDMDIEAFLMAVEDLKFIRQIGAGKEKNDFGPPDLVVEMTGLDERTRIIKIDLTPIEEKYISVRTGDGPVVLIDRDDLTSKLPEEIRPKGDDEKKTGTKQL